MNSSRFKALNKPIYILIAQKKDSIKRISIRPLTLFISLLAIISIAGMSGKKLFVSENLLIQQSKETVLQQEQQRLSKKLAEVEALLSLRDAQIDSMQQQLNQDSMDKQRMRQRLDLFDQVLAERKVAGIHFIRPLATWEGKHTIAYQLILVKGKNYPRWIIGHLAFTVSDAKGTTISIPVKENEKNNGSKIEMTTQSFIEGKLTWKPSWQPETLNITLFNHKGRNKGSIAISITQPHSSVSRSALYPQTAPQRDLWVKGRPREQTP